MHITHKVMHRTTTLILAVVVVLGGNGFAEPAPAAAEEQELIMEEVVVTGSRIRRSDFDSPTPTVSLGVGEIEASGAVELSEILLQLPGVVSGVNGGNSQTGVQRAGLDTIDLRSLGANRTLTLIDGHRAVSNRANNNSVSLSTIPSGFVDTVEVTTGGASAVYGSDAMDAGCTYKECRNAVVYAISNCIGKTKK